MFCFGILFGKNNTFLGNIPSNTNEKNNKKTIKPNAITARFPVRILPKKTWYLASNLGKKLC